MRNRSRAWMRVAVILAAAATIMVAPYQAQAFPVVNGGFETGDFSGWTLSGNTTEDFVVTSPVNSGDYSAQFGDVGTLSFISQTIATTPGASYTIDFFLANDIAPGSGTGPTNEFEFLWNGVPIFTLGPAAPPFGANNAFVPFGPFTVTATSTTSEIKFAFRNDPGWWNLDDVGCTTSTNQPCPAAAAPGPASLVLLGLGLVTVAGIGWRRRGKV